jgi:hypothetical protein
LAAAEWHSCIACDPQLGKRSGSRRGRLDPLRFASVTEHPAVALLDPSCSREPLRAKNEHIEYRASTLDGEPTAPSVAAQREATTSSSGVARALGVVFCARERHRDGADARRGSNIGRAAVTDRPRFEPARNESTTGCEKRLLLVAHEQLRMSRTRLTTDRHIRQS